MTTYISHSLPTVPLSRESRSEMRLLLLLSCIAAITPHTSRAHPNTYLYTRQHLGIAVEARHDRCFYTQDNVDCLLACINGYSPLLTTNSTLAFCWKVALYRSHDSKCWCHNDTAEFPLNASSSQPTLVRC